jgi:hypothetical protein
MKKVLVVLLLFITLGIVISLEASVWTPPQPDEWTLLIASDQLVTDGGEDETTSFRITNQEPERSYVVQLSGGFSKTYHVILQKSANGTTGWYDECEGDSTYGGTTNLLQFGVSESQLQQPFDDYIECSIATTYFYRIRVEENWIFHKLTTYVTVWKEDLT